LAVAVAVALANLKADHASDILLDPSVVLVSNDLPMRIKAGIIGLAAQEYRANQAKDPGYTGIVELEATDAQLQGLYGSDGLTRIDGWPLPPVNSGVVFKSPGGTETVLGWIRDRIGTVQLVRGDQKALGLKGRSPEQRIALELLLNPEIGIVSLGGRAGTGKSALALCAGLQEVKAKRHDKVIVFRPIYPVGGQELGYLPGTEGEKMAPWAQAVFDTLGSVSGDEAKAMIASRKIEVLPLTHIRGRSLHNAFVIVDEAQQLERGVLLTVLSRIGQGSRVVLTHDTAQRDNLRVGRYDGIAAVVELLKGHRLFAHITLRKSERSEIAELVTELLDR